MLVNLFFQEVVIKIEVKDNNVEQALRVLKRKLQRDGFFKVIKLKNTYEKPSEKKKRILQENIKREKKIKEKLNRVQSIIPDNFNRHKIIKMITKRFFGGIY